MKVKIIIKIEKIINSVDYNNKNTVQYRVINIACMKNLYGNIILYNNLYKHLFIYVLNI